MTTAAGGAEGGRIDPPSPFYRVQGLDAPDQEVVERYREGPRVGASKGPLGQVVMEGEVNRGGAGFPGKHQGGVHQCEKGGPGGGKRGGIG